LKKKQDHFKGVYTGKRTPIVRQVTTLSNTIIIDLDNPRKDNPSQDNPSS
jgi:hypothetical protein